MDLGLNIHIIFRFGMAFRLDINVFRYGMALRLLRLDIIICRFGTKHLSFWDGLEIRQIHCISFWDALKQNSPFFSLKQLQGQSPNKEYQWRKLNAAATVHVLVGLMVKIEQAQTAGGKKPSTP